jgi:uncharacterized membrane protein YhfC
MHGVLSMELECMHGTISTAKNVFGFPALLLSLFYFILSKKIHIYKLQKIPSVVNDVSYKLACKMTTQNSLYF